MIKLLCHPPIQHPISYFCRGQPAQGSTGVTLRAYLRAFVAFLDTFETNLDEEDMG